MRIWRLGERLTIESIAITQADQPSAGKKVQSLLRLGSFRLFLRTLRQGNRFIWSALIAIVLLGVLIPLTHQLLGLP